MYNTLIPPDSVTNPRGNLAFGIQTNQLCNLFVGRIRKHPLDFVFPKSIIKDNI